MARSWRAETPAALRIPETPSRVSWRPISERLSRESPWGRRPDRSAACSRDCPARIHARTLQTEPPKAARSTAPHTQRALFRPSAEHECPAAGSRGDKSKPRIRGAPSPWVASAAASIARCLSPEKPQDSGWRRPGQGAPTHASSLRCPAPDKSPASGGPASRLSAVNARCRRIGGVCRHFASSRGPG